MRTLRRIGMLGLAGAVITAFAAPAAHADTPETFSATGLPNATSTAGVATVNVNAQNLLNGLLANTPVGSLQLGSTVQQVTDQLTPVFDAIKQATGQTPVQLDPKTTIDELLNSLTNQQTLSLSLG